jgi:hypothetical protein
MSGYICTNCSIALPLAGLLLLLATACAALP